MHLEAVSTCFRNNVKGQPRIIVWIHLEESSVPMLHTKTQGYRLFDYGKPSAQ